MSFLLGSEFSLLNDQGIVAKPWSRGGSRFFCSHFLRDFELLFFGSNISGFFVSVHQFFYHINRATRSESSFSLNGCFLCLLPDISGCSTSRNCVHFCACFVPLFMHPKHPVPSFLIGGRLTPTRLKLKTQEKHGNNS